LAHPALHAAEPEARQVSVKVYGKGDLPFTLYEDDDLTLEALGGKYNRVILTWDGQKGRVQRIGQGAYPRYEITGWEQVGQPRET